ncbi:transposase [Nonomuraea sp. B5E05]|uniref:transposase n=1 Tax=Nonomuraea sp. B5E05 TaxID=3153569 RepID=UPI003260669E
MVMKNYPPEFKPDAVALVLSSPDRRITSIAKDRGISRETLPIWVRAAQAQGAGEPAGRPALVRRPRPGAYPRTTCWNRGSFSIAWQASRNQINLAAGVITGTVIDLVGTIGQHVLTSLLPQRRLRVSPRIVKRAISKYQARGPRIDRTSYKATTSIAILAPAGP